MAFWVKSTGWIVVILFVYISSRQDWTWDFYDRKPRMNSLTKWWEETGLPLSIFMVLRWLLMAVMLILYYKMTQRLD